MEDFKRCATMSSSSIVTFKLQEILHQVFYDVSLTKGGTTLLLLWSKNTGKIQTLFPQKGN
jgi:hypothetical protein